MTLFGGCHGGNLLTSVGIIGLAAMATAGEFAFESPAPGRGSGRIYYYVPDGIYRS